MSLSIAVDLELNQALSTLSKLESEFIKTKQKLANPMQVDVNTGKATDVIGNLSKTFNEVAKSSRQVESEIKNAMATLVASGQKGTTEFESLRKKLLDVTSESQKLDNAMKEVNKAIEQAPNKVSGFDKIKSTFGDIGKMALSFAGGGALLGGLQGIVGGFGDIVEAGKKAYERTEQLKIAFSTAGLTGKDLEKALKDSGKAASEISNRFGVSAGSVKEVQTQIALLGGITGKSNDKIAEASIGIEKLTKGQIDATTVVRALTKGGAEGAEGLGRLSARFPQLAAGLQGIKDPGEKAAKAIELLQNGFTEIEKSPLTSMDRFKNGLASIKSTIGSTLIEVFAPLMQGLATVLLGAVNLFKGAIGIIKEYYPIFIGLAAAAAGYAIAINAAAISTAILTTAQTIATSVTSLWTAAQTALNVAMTANPLGLIIAAIAVLGAAIYIIIDKTIGWKTVIEYLWASIKIGWEIIKAVGISLYTYWITPFKIAWDVIVAMVNGIGNIWSKLKNLDFAGAFEEAKKAGTAIGGAVVDGVKEQAGKIGDAWSGAIDNSKKIWDGIDTGKQKTDELKGKQKSYQEVIEDTYNSLKKITDQYDEQIGKVGDILKGLKENYTKDLTNYQNYLKIKQLDKDQFERLLAITQDENQKKELIRLRNLTSEYGKSATEKLKFSQDIFKKMSTTEEETAKLFNTDAEKQKEKSKQAAKTELEILEARLKVLNDIINKQKQGSDDYNNSLNEITKISFRIDEIKVNEENLKKGINEAISKAKITANLLNNPLSATEIKPIRIKDGQIKFEALKIDADKILPSDQLFLGFDVTIREHMIDTAKAVQDAFILAFEEIGNTSTKISQVISENDNKLKAQNKTKLNYDEELNKLQTAYNKDEITYREYLDQKKRLDDERLKDSTGNMSEQDRYWKTIQNAMLKTFEVTIKKQTEARNKEIEKYNALLEKGIEDETILSEQRQRITAETVKVATSQLIQLAISGKATIGDFVNVAIDAITNLLAAEIPAFVAMIFGTSTSQLGIAGVAVAAGLTAVLFGLAAAAKSALTSAKGAEEGYNPNEGKYGKRGQSDTELIWVNPKEHIFNQRISQRENKLFDFLHRGGTSEDYFESMYLDTIPRNAVLSRLNSIRAKEIVYISKTSNERETLNREDLKSLLEEVKLMRKSFQNGRLVTNYNNMKVTLDDKRKPKLELQEYYR